MFKLFTTDGSCSCNPGPGAYAVVQWEKRNDDLYIISVKRGTNSETTNNRMELEGVLHVLKAAAADSPDTRYEIHSDSAYCINMLKPGGWIDAWSRNGWKNSKKKDVENIDLIKELYKYRTIIFDRSQDVEFIWVHGHNGDIKNEITDAIAQGNKSKLKKFLLDNNIKIDIE